MKTVLNAIVTLSVTINCSYDKAFEYLSQPLNQKEWAIHFFQDIEEIDGKFIATLPFGKMPMEIKADAETGVLDIFLGSANPTRTRLNQIEDTVCVYNFTLVQPPNMPDEVWQNKALPDMQDELNRLKTILESNF